MMQSFPLTEIIPIKIAKLKIEYEMNDKNAHKTMMAKI